MSDFTQLRSRLVTGAAAGNLTVTGIKAGDRLLVVQDMTVAGANLASEFTVTADNTINNTGGTSTATHLTLIQWEARGGGRYDTSVRPGRSGY